MQAGSKRWYDESGIYAAESEVEDLRIPEDPRHVAFFERAKSPGSLLDLGCGHGVFLRLAQTLGFEVSGIEFQDTLARKAREVGLSVETGDLTEVLSERQETYDYVTALDVLEHLEDPGLIVEQMLARLSSNGVAVVSVPHQDRKPAVFDSVIDAPPHHLTIWTVQALKALFETRGASVTVVELPLSVDDLFLHHVWRRHGHDSPTTTRWDGLVRRCLKAEVALRSRLSLSRGHTLVAYGTF